VKLKYTRGFTLIELMVALVVAGLLMGVLVGLSGAVQKSLGFSKEITELQANLRFAVKTVVDDISRVAEGIRARLDQATARSEMLAGSLDAQMDEVLEKSTLEAQLAERKARLGL